MGPEWYEPLITPSVSGGGKKEEKKSQKAPDAAAVTKAKATATAE
jgi:hypothetical protein